MIELQLAQGSDEWAAARAKHFCASDAPAMMGESLYVSRNELLKQKATGIIPEIDPGKQALFDRGHTAEAKARPLVEDIIGEELYPVVATDDAGRLLASSDGTTMLCNIGFEHKLWNDKLAASVAAGNVPDSHKWQLDHQIAVFGFEKIIFVVSDGTPEKFVYCWYETTPERINKLMAGWQQFEADLKNYRHLEEAPAAVTPAIESLPALTVQLVGEVRSTNLATWKDVVVARIQAINTDLKTDDDFAVAEKTVTFLGDGEKELETVKKQALAQTASIDELFRTVDTLKEEMRTKRLTLEKLVKARKEAIRSEIVLVGNDAIVAHVEMLNQRIGKPWMPRSCPDFAGAIKGKKTVASLRDAVDTELARAKIAANEIADRIQMNLATLRELAANSPALFPDAQALCVGKANDDLTALVKNRIAEHQAAEEKRLEAEREKIRQEEQAKAEAAARAKQQEEERAAQQAAQVIEAAKVEKAADDAAAAKCIEPIIAAEIAARQEAPAATLKLGEINAALGVVSITADQLAALGFKPHTTDKSAKLYLASHFPLICAAIARHITAVANAPMKLAA